MLLQYGNTICNVDWKIDEKVPLGYSRVYYVYGGEVEYEDEQGKTKLKDGYLYIFPSATTYKMKQNRQNPLHCTFLHIDVFPALISNLIEIEVEKNPALKHLLISFSASIDENDLVLTHAVADVFEVYCKEHSLIVSPTNQISAVLSYIAEHMEENMTVETLSKKIGYNEQYFIRLFKKNVGLTPYQYIIIYRLKEAKKMLKAGLTISQIAKLTGFSDIKSFSRTFKERFGLSPSAFRNAYTVQP